MDLLTLTSKTATLKIGAKGCITSLKLRNGLELVRRHFPMIVAELKDGTILCSRKFSLVDLNLLHADWEDRGSISILAETTGDYFRFTIRAFNIPGLKQIRFCQIAPTCLKYFGVMGGMYSDDETMVCLRSLSLKGNVDHDKAKNVLYAYSESYLTECDVACALVASPRAKILGILQNMTVKENVPKSVNGGAWALQSEAARGSYVFADVKFSDVDDWIDIAKRGGFEFIHFHGWWHTLGHYDVNRNFYPNGIEDMKKAVDKVHAAGLKASFHTLTACIEPDDPWISPVPVDDLIACCHYTLARPMKEADDVLYINEKPMHGHELVWSYSCNGNAIKIGKEIIQYHEVSYEKPYCFRQCVRGAFGTTSTNHQSDEDAAYLQQRYLAFYPEPDGRTSDELADAIAAKYKYLGLQGMYFDGSEGMRSRYGIDVMRWKIFQRLPQDAIIEASHWGHNDWWFHTRLGAWDHTAWAMRKNHESHIKMCSTVPKSNLLVPQMGWWAARGPIPECRGQFVDECEFFEMKNLSIDGPMSLQELNPSRIQWNERIFDMLTILGWYERFRLARYFRENDLARLRIPSADFKLRMNDKGTWQLIPQFVSKRRLPEINKGQSWSVRNPHEDQPFKARIEALYSLNVNSPKEHVFIDFSEKGIISVENSARHVVQKLSIVKPDKTALFSKLRIDATNSGRIVNGAWALAGMHFPHPYRSTKGCDGFGIWVKGDHSGALLNLQFQKPPQFGDAVSDHYIAIDFTGWKYFTILFRERDAEYMSDHKWPYSSSAGNLINTLCLLDLEHIDKVNLYLNNIPAHGRTLIEIGDIVVFPQAVVTLSNIRLDMNGEMLRLPVSMQSGDYIELDGSDTGEHFSEQGRLLERFEVVLENGKKPTIRKGYNCLELTADASDGLTARAEFTLFTHGIPFGKRSSKVNWEHLQLDYELPRIILAENGRDNVWSIRRRKESVKSSNDVPVLDFTLDVDSAGIIQTAEPVEKTLVDDCSHLEEYRTSQTNHYEKYALDEVTGISAKSGTAFQIKSVTGRNTGKCAMRFLGASSRGGDHTGWVAVGKHFGVPIDLSQKAGIGVWFRSDISSAAFKIQIVDVNGKGFDMVTQLCDRGWHYVEFPLEHTEVDLSKIEYIIYSLNDIKACRSAWVEIDEVLAVSKTATLKTPVLTIGGVSLEFPCVLKTGHVLHCPDQKNWTITDARGNPVNSGTVKGVFPILKHGVNPVLLEFRQKDSEAFRVIAKIVKKY